MTWLITLIALFALPLSQGAFATDKGLTAQRPADFHIQLDSKMKIDIAGERYGRLVAVSLAEGGSERRWTCRCDCGREITAAQSNLRKGNTTSCGCRRSEVLRQRNTTHGNATDAATSSEYSIWKGMVKRCRNPKATGYSRYGGRGITVCQRWLTFTNFLADMGARPSLKHSIDRIDNDGHYEPGNCRWATRSQQASNRSPRK